VLGNMTLVLNYLFLDLRFFFGHVNFFC